jgi:hypothetical protein
VLTIYRITLHQPDIVVTARTPTSASRRDIVREQMDDGIRSPFRRTPQPLTNPLLCSYISLARLGNKKGQRCTFLLPAARDTVLYCTAQMAPPMECHR